MKHFLYHIIIFFVGLILIISGIFFILSERHQFIPSSEYNYKEFENAFIEKNYDLIALGNSKLLSSIDKDVLQNETNFKSAILGYSSSNISVSRLTLEAYLNKCIIKPKVVLLEVSWFSFNQKRTSFHDITGDLQLEDPSLFKYLFRYGRKYNDNYILALKRQIFYTKRDTNIYFSKPLKKRNKNKKNYHFDLIGFQKVFPTHTAGFDKLLLEDFNKIVSICKKNKIKLILYTAPEDQEYSFNQKDRNEVKEVFNNLSFLNESIIYLDYSLGGNLYDKKFEFWLADSHHIFEKKLFTERLIRDIKSKYLISF